MLALATFNLVKFLIIGKKYTNLPLLLFYVLTILLCIFRLATDWLLFSPYVGNLMTTFLSISPAILKINIGLVKAFIICELAIRVKHTTRIILMGVTRETNEYLKIVHRNIRRY